MRDRCVEVGAQFRLAARGEIGHEAGHEPGLEQRQAGPGETLAGRANAGQPGRDAEVAGRVLRRVGHQPQVAEQGTGFETCNVQRGKVELRRIGVGGNVPEWRGFTVWREQGQGLFQPAGGLERAAVIPPLAGVGDAQAEARAVAERFDDQLLQPGGVDHGIAHASTRQGFEVPLDKRLAVHFQQRLGRVIGQRPHALAAPGGEKNRFHGASLALHVGTNGCAARAGPAGRDPGPMGVRRARLAPHRPRNPGYAAGPNPSGAGSMATILLNSGA